MVNAGFNPLEEIARKTGKSIGELKEEMSKGAISSKMVQDAFISATSAGGKFFGMSQEGAKTLNGQISMLQESFDMMFNEIGQKGEGVVIDAVKLGTSLVENYERVGKVLAGLVVTYGLYKTALVLSTQMTNGMTMAQVLHTTVTKALTVAEEALNKTILANPYVLAAVALGTLITAVVLAGDSMTAAERAQDNYNKKIEENSKLVKAEKDEIDKLIGTLEDETSSIESKNIAFNTLIVKYPTIFSKYKTENELIENITEARQRENAEIERKTELLGQKSYNESKTRATELNRLKYLQKNGDIRGLQTQGGYKKGKDQDEYIKLWYKYHDEIKKTQTWYGTESGAIDRLASSATEEYKININENRKRQIAKYNANIGNLSKAQAQEELAKLRYNLKRMDKSGKDYLTIDNNEPLSRAQIKERITLLENNVKTERKTMAQWRSEAKKEAKKNREAAKELASSTELLTKDQAEKKMKEATDAVSNSEKAINHFEFQDKSNGNKSKSGKTKVGIPKQADFNKLARERSDAERELADKSSQVYIDSLQNGYEKEKKQRELNHKKELDDLEKYKRDFLQKKISDAKQIFDADPKNKGKSFDPLSVSLSDDENKRFDDMRKNIMKKQENEDKEYQKKRVDSFNSYLKLYGDIQERRLAIAKEYDEKIAKSQTEGERLSLKAEKMKALSDFDLKNMKESMNWEDLFGELGNLSVRQLEGIKAKLREILQSDGLSVEDYKTTVEQIDRVNSAIIDEQDKQQSFFKFTTDYAKERRKLELDVADALKTQSDLLEKQKTLSSDVRAKKDRVWLMLSTMGVSYRGGIDISKNNDILDSVGKKYGVDSKQYKEVQEALDGLAENTIKLNETSKKKLDADGKAITAQSRLTKLIGDFTSRLSGFIQGFEKINANIQELPELLEKLGVDGKSDVGLAVQSFANASDNALGAMKDFESGNYIGAVSKGISAIGDFVDGSISLFAGHGNEKAMEEEVARLSSANKELSYSIDKLSEQIIKKDNTNEQSIDAYKKAVKAQEEWQSNQQKAIDNRAGEWTNTGYGFLKLKGKKSFNYYAKKANSWVWNSMNKALSEQGYTKQITSIGNRDNPNDFWNLSPEEMKAIRTYANEAWRELFSSDGHHNPEELVNEYIERAGNLDKLKDQLNEKLTGFSWEGFRNNYLSVLQDMKSDTNYFAKNINNILSKSILESLVNKKYNQRIKEIQNMVAKAAEDGTITVEEANAIRNANKNLSDDMLRDREQLISKGLLVDEQTKEQSASANGVSSITYEQASNIVALTTAGNISRDQIKDVLLSQKLSSIDLSLTGISLIGKDTISIADETRTILANSYMELKEINENTGVSAKCLTQIDENINSMNRLIKEKL